MTSQLTPYIFDGAGVYAVRRDDTGLVKVGVTGNIKQRLRSLAPVDQLEASSPAEHMSHLHRLLKEGADVSIAYSAALSDGVVDPVEWERLISELRESIRAHRSVLEMLEAAGRPRVLRGGVA